MIITLTPFLVLLTCNSKVLIMAIPAIDNKVPFSFRNLIALRISRVSTAVIE